MKTIKIACIGLLILAFSVPIFAQDNAEKTPSVSHHLAFSVFSMADENWNGMIYPWFDIMYYYPQRKLRPLPGLQYTLQYKDFYARVGVNGLHLMQHTKESSYQVEEFNSWSRVMIGAGGITRIKKFYINYGVDFFAQRAVGRIDYEYENPEYNNKNTTNDRALGISPYAGIGYSLNKRFSLGFESAARFESWERSWKNTPQNSGSYSGDSGGSRAFMALVSLLQLSMRL